jgi:hypothetical protein
MIACGGEMNTCFLVVTPTTCQPLGAEAAELLLDVFPC